MNFKERAHELVSQMTLAEKCSQMKYDAPAIERLGIPEYNWWNEALHGVARAGVATVFPQAIALAASFNTDLMYKVATAISDEARAKYNEFKTQGKTEISQGLTFWSPNINIFRDPRWGRGHETYGEDPFLTGEMGCAFVKGLQGDHPVYRKTDATLKHYAVHSGPEKIRHEFNAEVGKKDLYETYLYAFKYCIDHADPSAVMGAYNRINGEPCCASKTYLLETLFNEFNFPGYVVSDCGAICDINYRHQVTENEAESAALAVNNGCQLACDGAYKWLKSAVALGMITEETITEACEKLFEARFRLGMFDNDCPYDNIPYDVVECDEHIALSRKMSSEGIVLLKNNGILPLDKTKLNSIAVIGPNANDYSVLLGNYNGTPSIYSTFLKGIQDAFDGRVHYAYGCHHYNEANYDWAEKTITGAVLAAKRSDVTVLFLGLNPSMEGEEGDQYNSDYSGDKKNVELPDVQKKLLDAVLAVGKPVILVNVSGSAVNLKDGNERCEAVLQCFYPGAEGGNAMADVLFGECSPSGRLPVTFYESTDDIPEFTDYSMVNRTYKYFNGTPVYPFGYGLSYSKFEYSNVEAKVLGEDIIVSCDVKNIGGMACPEATEVFIQYSVEGKEIPKRKLVGFKKTELDVNGDKKLEFTIAPEVYCLFDDNGKAYIPHGKVTLTVGSYFEAENAQKVETEI